MIHNEASIELNAVKYFKLFNQLIVENSFMTKSSSNFFSPNSSCFLKEKKKVENNSTLHFKLWVNKQSKSK